MIRNNRVFIAINAAAATLCAVMGIAYALRTNAYHLPFLPSWSQAALYGLLMVGFLYQIDHRLRHGIADSVGGLNDRQLWMLKIAGMLVIAAIAIIILLRR
jgi:hypothetical protein